jgi:hypothetical protein
MTPEELATRVIKRQYSHLRPAVAEKIASFVTRPKAARVWERVKLDFEAMLDGLEPTADRLRNEHYAGWTDNDIRALVEAVSKILMA